MGVRRLSRSVLHQGRQLATQRRNHRQAVEQMVGEHFLRVTHRREVVDLGPFGNQVHVIQQLGLLVIGQGQAQIIEPFLQGWQQGMHQTASVELLATASWAKPLTRERFK